MKDYNYKNSILFERLDKSYERISDLTNNRLNGVRRSKLAKYPSILDFLKERYREEFGEDLSRENNRFLGIVNELILLNRLLIYPFAGFYAVNCDVEYEDLCQEGILSLRRAIFGYDRERGFRFSTYASYWIRQGIQRHIPNNKIVRIPIHVFVLGERIEKLAQLMYKKGSKELTFEEAQGIALECEVGIRSAVVAIETNTQRHISLDWKVDENIFDVGNRLPQVVGQRSVEELFIGVEDNYILLRRLATLSAREEYVMRKRLFDGFTLEKIGNLMSLTRERVRQIEKEAKEKLKIEYYRDEVSA